MSITTKRGDDGQTDLLFGKRIAKTDPRIEALGAIDELNAALGLVRAFLPASHELDAPIAKIQRQLIALMGQLATLPEDQARYQKQGYDALRAEDVTQLESQIAEIEGTLPPPKDWALPGAAHHPAAAHCDHARTVCRRAERLLWARDDAPPGALYLNRLSDLLWLVARRLEANLLPS